MIIGVLSPADSRPAQALARRLEALEPGCVRHLDLVLEESERVILQQDRLSWNGLPLDQVEKLLVAAASGGAAKKN